MAILRKISHYLKYLIGLILQNPKLVMQEFLEDYRKDKKSVNIKKVTTKGDIVRNKRLSDVGGKGLFTKKIEKAYLKIFNE